MCSLKFWQTAFKNHTKEKTGILKAERLRDALLEVGFQLSSDILATLILRFMRKDGTLRFGDFVAAILHLTVSFSKFSHFFYKYFCESRSALLNFVTNKWFAQRKLFSIKKVFEINIINRFSKRFKTLF